MSALSFDVTMQRLENSDPDSVSSLPRLTPLNVNPCASASCWIARSRLWMALWLSEVTPTRLPCRISATAMRAPCQVLPDPGGPWTNR